MNVIYAVHVGRCPLVQFLVAHNALNKEGTVGQKMFSDAIKSEMLINTFKL